MGTACLALAGAERSGQRLHPLGEVERRPDLVATLRQNVFHHVAKDVGEAEIPPLVFASQLRMVDTQKV